MSEPMLVRVTLGDQQTFCKAHCFVLLQEQGDLDLLNYTQLSYKKRLFIVAPVEYAMPMDEIENELAKTGFIVLKASDLAIETVEEEYTLEP